MYTTINLIQHTHVCMYVCTNIYNIYKYNNKVQLLHKIVNPNCTNIKINNINYTNNHKASTLLQDDSTSDDSAVGVVITHSHTCKIHRRTHFFNLLLSLSLHNLFVIGRSWSCCCFCCLSSFFLFFLSLSLLFYCLFVYCHLLCNPRGVCVCQSSFPWLLLFSCAYCVNYSYRDGSIPFASVCKLTIIIQLCTYRNASCIKRTLCMTLKAYSYLQNILIHIRKRK